MKGENQTKLTLENGILIIYCKTNDEQTKNQPTTTVQYYMLVNLFMFYRIWVRNSAATLCTY